MSNFDSNNSENLFQYAPIPAKTKKRRRKLKIFLAFLVVVGGFLFFTTDLLSKTNKIFSNKQNIFFRVGKLFISSDKELIGEQNGSVNILLLGMGGPGHDGPLLTDTMLVANLDVKTGEVILISLPRDFVLQGENGFNKINSAYAYAEAAEENAGGPAAMAAAEKLTGLRIPYYAAIDFKGFVSAVNHLGGLDVDIARTFTDSQYPNNNQGYIPPVTFTKGVEHMDGERALIYARSRHSNVAVESSDFARSERQKKIILAFKDKIANLDITDLPTINNLLNDFTQNFQTNLEPHEMKRLAELSKDINKDKVLSLALTQSNNLICDGIIEEPTGRMIPKPTPAPTPTPPASSTPKTGNVSGTKKPVAQAPPPAPEMIPEVIRIYVIQPCEGKSLTDIHQFIANGSLIAKLKNENARIEIQNSTGKPYVLDSWRTVANSGFNVEFKTFNGSAAYDRTIIYDNSSGQKPLTLDYLKNNYNFVFADVPYSATTADFVIVLGKDAL